MDNTGYTDGGNSHIFDYVLMRVLENMRRTYQGKTELTAIMDDGSSHKVRIVVDNTSGKRGLVTVYDSDGKEEPVSFKARYYKFHDQDLHLPEGKLLYKDGYHEMVKEGYDYLRKYYSSDNEEYQNMAARVGERMETGADAYLKSIGRGKEAGDYNWEFFVNDDKEINLSTLSGGKILINEGAMDRWISSDNDLAVVLGHEMAHEIFRHIYIYDRNDRDSKILKGYLLNDGGVAKEDLRKVSGRYRSTFRVMADWRDNERQADLAGLRIAKAAGYDISGAGDLWRRFKFMEDVENVQNSITAGDGLEMTSDHPMTADRLQDISILSSRLRGSGVPVTALAGEANAKVTDAIEKMYGGKVTGWARSEGEAVLRGDRSNLLNASIRIYPSYDEWLKSGRNMKDKTYGFSITGTEDRMTVTVKTDGKGNGKPEDVMSFETKLDSFDKDLRGNVEKAFGKGSHFIVGKFGDTRTSPTPTVTYASDFILSNYNIHQNDIDAGNGKVIDSYIVNTLSGNAVFNLTDTEDYDESDEFYYKEGPSTRPEPREEEDIPKDRLFDVEAAYEKRAALEMAEPEKDVHRNLDSLGEISMSELQESAADALKKLSNIKPGENAADLQKDSEAAARRLSDIIIVNVGDGMDDSRQRQADNNNGIRI